VQPPRWFDFLGEYVKRIALRWWTVITAALDALGLVIVLGVTGAESMTVALPVALTILAVILFLSGFQVFRDERRKRVPTLRPQLHRSGIWPPRVDVTDGTIEVQCSVVVVFLNGGGSDKLLGARARWERAPRWWERGGLPLLSVELTEFDHAEVAAHTSPFPLTIAGGEVSPPHRLQFEGIWRGRPEDRPVGRTRLMLHLDFLASPPIGLFVGELDMDAAAWNDAVVRDELIPFGRTPRVEPSVRPFVD